MMPIFLWSMLVIQSRHSAPHATEVSDGGEHGDAAAGHGDEGVQQDGLVERNGVPVEPAEQVGSQSGSVWHDVSSTACAVRHDVATHWFRIASYSDASTDE